MLLKNSDFITSGEMAFDTISNNEMFIRPHGNKDYYIHELELGFVGGEFGEYFFIRDKKHSLDSIMKQISDARTGRYPSANMRTFFKKNGNIISANLARVIKYKAYIVYVEDDKDIRA